MARTGALVALLACTAPGFAHAKTYESGSVYARVTDDALVLGNELVERRWERESFRTTALVDRRGPNRRWSETRRDFTLFVSGAANIGSQDFSASAVDVDRLRGGGLRLEIELEGPGIGATRVAEAYPGIAGFRTQTTLESPVPLVLAGATLDEAAVGAAEPTIHAFRAGADWRDPEYGGPPFSVGDSHAGAWRDSRSAGSGEALLGPAQWLSAGDGDRSLFMVMERNDLPSSRAAYDGDVAKLHVDYTRDIVSLGPLEENAHVENPAPEEGRRRTIRPGEPFPLEAAFTGFGRGDGDEPWQHHHYLTERRLQPAYPKAVTFNSNGTDANRISTGAKDDMDFATVQEVAPIARRLGIETFILDDGWQARSGDWHPDSPDHPEPRFDGDPNSKFKPRFPDSEFRAVREAIAPMKLGLWMSPMHFHGMRSRTFQQHPDWGCAPAGHGTALLDLLQPDSSSSEAGIGTWSPAAIPHVESRIREAIESWGVSYFKFDFLVWLDCAGQGDIWDYHDAFVAMVDRLRRDHPQVTFQIDETNDYRMFPFESVARGPSWFQNGTPEPERLLHNLWNLAPYVPGFSLGQHFLGGRAWERYPVDTLMAAALPSHLTFFDDLRELPEPVIARASEWLAFYRANRGLFAQMLYPLLDDPMDKSWTALQAWNPERARGALLAFRQQSDESTQRIALRNVPGGRRFDLFLGPAGERVRTVTSAELRRGLLVEVPAKDGAAVFTIRPR